ncbi:MAG TPA: hypothetical protein VM534_09285 [Thermoanaerobaculia bacterium]|nr:hypothetical protein [Thermoanaerobaculia bacterium]
MRTTFLLSIALLAAPPLFGWGWKGHTMVNEAATHAVPAELPAFFHRAYPRLVYLGYEPDRWRQGGDSLDAMNAPEHFLDYEYVSGLDLPKERNAFIELLIASGTLDRYGIEVSKPGFLPWRVAELCDLLELQWRTWRRGDLTADERLQVEESIIYHAGVLGHYIADGANPHHATIHYNGWVGVPNAESYPTDCDAHFRFESAFVTRAVELSEILPEMAEVTPRADYFATAVELIRESNNLVERLYALDRDGGFQQSGGSQAGEDFAARRLAHGASLLRDLWWSTWRNSASWR